jgi:DNA-directed RNA polymerase subunit beta'
MADIHTLDPERAMQALKDGTIQVLKDTLPIEGRTRILRATNVYAGPNVHIDDIHAQKRARVRNRTWAVPILADMELVDKASGKVVSKTKGVRLLNLPHYTRRYSFIVDGTEYQADNQWRLKAGAYTRMKANGGLETQFNLSKGRGFRVSFDPKKRQFLATHGTTNTPLVPLLQTLGISAEEMETAWGPEVYQTAARLQRKGQMAKLAKTLNPRSEATTPEEVEDVVRESFAATELRPDTTSVTLGKGFTTVTGEALLLAANKLLGVSRGTAEVDNRDSLRFKELWTVADHLPERIKNSRRRVERKIRNNLDRRDDIRKIVTPDVFNVPVKSFFTSTSLSQRPSQLNPVDMIGGHLKATLMGTGGISTENAVSHSAKMLDSSQMGFTDPFHSPEGTRSGITTHLTLGVSKRGNEPVIKVWDVKNSKWADVSPTELHGKTLAFPDQYDTGDGKTFKPRKDLITVIRGGEGDPTNVKANEVDYVLRSPKAMFSFTANLIPFLPSDQANRAGMAARHMEQTVPLKNPEEPLLQVASGSDQPAWDTWEKILGQMQSHASPVSGTVKSVEAERIVVAGDDGKKHVVQLYDNYPLNDSKAFVTSKPLVQKGDEVKKDDVIADTSFTKGGVLSMGTNLRVGYLAYKGLNYEDGITISETAAKKLTSEHLHKPRVYLDTGMMMGLKKFRANFPGVVSDANAAKLDEDGVIKRGEIVRPGDVIATVLKEADPSAEQIMLKGIHKSLAKPYRDRSLTWNKPYTGVVTEVVRNGKEVVAYVKTAEEADIGDKLTSRHGNKGVVVAILPDEEMPRDGDGAPLEIVLNPSGVPGRINPGQVLENAITLAAVEDGKPYAVSNFDGDEGHRISVGDVSTKIVQVKGHYRTIKSGKGSKRIWIEPYEYETGYKGLIDQILEKKGLSETTELFDPETGKSLGPVMTGHQYILKQEHQVDKKLSARAHGYGHAYNANMVPRGTYGGNDGAQRYGELGLYAMIAHGAVNNIRDALSWKCFPYHEKVLTDQGEIEIGKIVTNRLPVKVLTWSDEEGLCYRPIKNYWRRNGEQDRLVRVTAHRRRSGEFAFVKGTVLCTEEHQFYVRREGQLEKVWAKDLRPGVDAILTWGNELSEGQHDLLLGSLLGDGYMAQKETSRFPYFQERHSVKQREYLQFKADALSSFTHRELREYTAGYQGFSCGQQMVEWSSFATPEFLKLHRQFYASGERRFPQEVWDLLTLRSLAIWFQDDGCGYRSLSNGGGVQAGLAVYSMNSDERKSAIAAIERLTEVHFNDNVDHLKKHGVAAEHFLSKLGPYLHPSLSYKTCDVVAPIGQKLVEFSAPGAPGLVETPVDAVEPAGCLGDLPEWRGKYLFNLEVEDTHRYFVRGFLVGNSDRSQDEIWTAIQTGQMLPAPRPSFAYEKFLGYLNGLGVNVEKHGNELVVLPMTDKQITEMSSGALEDGGKVVRGKDLRPEKGGLFDEEITGGVGGKNWSHLVLAESMPNPLFEKGIRSLLGLTGKQYDGILAGKVSLDKDGKVTEEGGATGPAALAAALSGIEVDKELTAAKEEIKTARRSSLDKVNKRIKYLLMLNKTGLSAREAYVLENLPVVPPQFRPISVMEAGDLNVDGLNLLYRDVSLLSDQLKAAKGVLPDAELFKLRTELYSAVEALMGTATASDQGLTTDGQPRPPGILNILSGRTSPKESYFHKAILDRKQDLTMRSVIVPDMSLHLDEMGLPKKGAMKIFRPFVVKEMVAMGYTPLQAREEIEKDTSLANKALAVVASKRPVLFKRDPVLHKFGIMAFKARIIDDEKAIHIHPLVVGGFNADFDGDAMGVFVPISQGAVDEAYKMMPSKNLFNPSTGKVMYQPSLEGQLGLFMLTQFGKRSREKFASNKDAIDAANKGDIAMTDVVTVDGKKTTAGRLKIAGALPASLRTAELLEDADFTLNNKSLQGVLRDLATDHPAQFANSVDKLKDLGFGFAYSSGFSFDSDDFNTLSTIRDKHLKVAQAREKVVRGAGGTRKEQDGKVVALYQKATADIKNDAEKYLQATGNRLYTMYKAGVKPGWSQLQQLIIAPLLMENADGRIIPVPVTKSYAEGLSTAGYWTASSGARKGLIEKVQSVSEPGALSKQIVNTAIPQVITVEDCGTTTGIHMKIGDSDLVDRVLVKGVKAKGQSFRAGSLITPQMVTSLKAARVDGLVVRSPTKCESHQGMCAKCYGAMDGGGPVALGTNIGVIAGQAIGEVGTQLSMRVFHTGGASGAGGSSVVGGIERVKQLLKIPQTLPGKATLAQVPGRVGKIAKSAVGGYDITVGGEEHYIPHGRTLQFKVGATVKKGDALSSGPVDPRELLTLTNLDRVQRYLTDEVHGVYAEAGVKKRNVEVVVRALTNLGVVEDPGEVGDEEGIIRNDYVSLTKVNALNRANKGKETVKVVPVLRGVETLALDQTTDWIARLQYRKLKETFTRAANEGWKSDIHGVHPAPGIAYTAEFGKPDSGSKSPY